MTHIVNKEYKIRTIYPLGLLFAIVLFIIVWVWQIIDGESIGVIDISVFLLLIYCELYFLMYSCRIEGDYLIIRKGIYEKNVFISDVKDIKIDTGLPFIHSAILVLKNKKKVRIFPLKNSGELIEKMTQKATPE